MFFFVNFIFCVYVFIFYLIDIFYFIFKVINDIFFNIDIFFFINSKLCIILNYKFMIFKK